MYAWCQRVGKCDLLTYRLGGVEGVPNSSINFRPTPPLVIGKNNILLLSRPSVLKNPRSYLVHAGLDLLYHRNAVCPFRIPGSPIIALVLDPDDYCRRRMLDDVATNWGSARSVALTMSTNRRTPTLAAWETSRSFPDS